MKHFKHIADMHRYNGNAAPEHPFFSVVRCGNSCGSSEREFTTDFYMIGFKKLRSGIFRYGRTKYDHETGSMSFIKPRQVVQFKDLEYEEDGFMVFIHEDYLNGHHLNTFMGRYSFFDYETDEALHLTPSEEKLIWDLFGKIEAEYNNNPDEYSKEIILTHVDSILKYAQRFYKRQFINRSELSGKTVSKFQHALDAYSRQDRFQIQGLPTVGALATELNLSSRYLSDLLKQETGKTAMELIHIYLVKEAKNRLLKDENLTISEIAYDLGFENLPYFSRLFKKETGLTPKQYKREQY